MTVRVYILHSWTYNYRPTTECIVYHKVREEYPD